MLRDEMPDGWRDTAEALGWIALESAELDWSTQMVELALIGHRAAPAVFGQNFRVTLAACEALLKERIGPPELPHLPAAEDQFCRNLQALLGRAGKAMTDRGNYIHAQWGPVWNGDSQQGVLPKRGGKMWIKDVTRAEMDELMEQLHEISELLSKAAGALKDFDEQREAESR